VCWLLLVYMIGRYVDGKGGGLGVGRRRRGEGD